MKVYFKKFNENAKMPTKAYDKDFCYDCYAVSEEEIAPNVWKYDLGFGLQILRDNELLENSEEILVSPLEYIETDNIYLNFKKSPINLSFDIRPRSSVWKTGMSLANCEGTVDEGYRNSIAAIFYHVMPNMPRYRVGDKICQLKLGATLPLEFVEVDSLDNSERGLKGFGSSGK